MSVVEKSIPERVTRLEATMQAVLQGLAEIKQELKEMRVEVNSRMDVWLRWMLGIMLSSWFTLMVSIWLKR